MNNNNFLPHALVSSDVTRNTFTTNGGFIMGMQFGSMAAASDFIVLSWESAFQRATLEGYHYLRCVKDPGSSINRSVLLLSLKLSHAR